MFILSLRWEFIKQKDAGKERMLFHRYEIMDRKENHLKIVKDSPYDKKVFVNFNLTKNQGISWTWIQSALREHGNII
ncbi:MAG: hypothetical protein DRP86_02825 [Candidatus Neomarinimicrobiota bacterium]|nr:MAG: hypothetical protein DRP86_02825 [Candidatus Neomarinimicrobiota bacterium]